MNGKSDDAGFNVIINGQTSRIAVLQKDLMKSCAGKFKHMS